MVLTIGNRAMEQVVAAIMRSGDSVLLCHRRSDRTWYPDVWDLPGGHVELEETPHQALVRELKEELDVEVMLPEAAPTAILVEDGVEFHLWVVEEWAGDVTNTAEGEHDSIRWFTEPEIEELSLASRMYVNLLFAV